MISFPCLLLRRVRRGLFRDSLNSTCFLELIRVFLRYAIVSNHTLSMSLRFRQVCSIMLAASLLLSPLSVRLLGQESQGPSSVSSTQFCSMMGQGDCCCVDVCGMELNKRGCPVLTADVCTSAPVVSATATLKKFTHQQGLDRLVFSSENEFPGLTHTRSAEGFISRLLRPPRPPHS